MQSDTQLVVSVTILCTLISAFVAWFVADKTLKKQDRINDLKDIVKLTYRLITSAEAYWLSAGRDIKAEHQLKHKTKRLIVEIEQIFSGDKKRFKVLEQKGKEFRMKITGGQFESKNRTEELGRVSNINEMGMELIDLIKNPKKQ